MNEKRKQMWIDFVTTFLGEECVAYIRAHPCEPELEIEPGAIVLNEVVNEEERFLYYLLPRMENSQKILASSVDSINALWNLWWIFVSMNHHIFGELGIRKGWMLVQPKTENPFANLFKSLQKDQKTTMFGKFEFKNKDDEKNFLS